MKGRVKEERKKWGCREEKDIFHPLFYSPNGPNNWARLQKIHAVFPWGGRAQVPRSSSTALLGPLAGSSVGGRVAGT